MGGGASPVMDYDGKASGYDQVVQYPFAATVVAAALTGNIALGVALGCVRQRFKP